MGKRGAALAAKGLKITVSQSLELIAEAFGVTDWNTLAAAIRRKAVASRNRASAAPVPTVENVPGSLFCAELEATLDRALTYANQRKHEYATLEHLLLALIDDVDASAAMKACELDLRVLKENLVGYIDNELKKPTIDDGGESKPSPAFQRVVQRAVVHVKRLARHTVTGTELLVGIFAETQSRAAFFLSEQEMTAQDAANFIVHGIVKRGGDAAV